MKIKKINYKMLLSFVVLTFLMVGSIMIVKNSLYRVALEKEREEKKLRIDKTVTLVDDYIKRVKYGIYGFSKRKVMKKFVEEKIKDEKALKIREELELLKTILNISGIYILDRSGNIILNSEFIERDKKKFIDQNLKEEMFFKKAMQGDKGLYVTVQKFTNRRVVYIASPIGDNKGIFGVLLAEINVSKIDDMLTKGGDEKHLMNSNGIIFATTNQDYLYNYIKDIDSMRKNEIERSGQFGGNEIKSFFDAKILTERELVIEGRNYNYYRKGLESVEWSIMSIENKKSDFILNIDRDLIIIIVLVFLLFYIESIFYLFNIKRRDENEKKVLMFKTIIEQSPLSIVITDLKGDIQYANSGFFDLTGYNFDELKGKNPRVLKSGIHVKGFYEEMWSVIEAGNNWRGEFYNKKKNGDYYWEEANIFSILDKKGEKTSYVAIKADVTEKKKLEQRLNYFATIDDMTGVYNRRTGLVFLENHMALSDRNKKRLTICYMDINDLKMVNDEFGHDSGDELIKTSVNIFKKSLRTTDLMCRMGGDEFLVIFPETKLDESKIILKRIENFIEDHNTNSKINYSISVSMGVVEYESGSGMDSNKFISIADEIMYDNKQTMKLLKKLK